MTGLSSKALWWAYLETARQTNRVSADLVCGSIDGVLGRRQQVRYAKLKLKLRGVLTAKLDADAQERDALRLQLQRLGVQPKGAQEDGDG